MTKRVAHLTSVHRRSDTRIFEKECRSLKRAGYDVHLVVADSLGDDSVEGVEIHDVGSSRGRVRRMTGAVARTFKKARALNADLYHLHDPELIPIGLILKRKGAKVVFDCHENIPLQLLSKPYLAPLLRRPVSALYATFERLLYPYFDATVTVTPSIASKLSRINPNTVLVRNFPRLDDKADSSSSEAEKSQAKLVYVGSISSIRGIREMVSALELLKGEVTLDLVGSFAGDNLRDEMKAQPGWQWVHEHGWLERDEATQKMSQAMAGLVLFHPEPNHLDALPNKLFEYMNAEIAVIASDIELWRQIIEQSECGICVDPLDPAAIAGAVRSLLDQPQNGATLGRNGRAAVIREYNWEQESGRLLDLYEVLLGARSHAEEPG